DMPVVETTVTCQILRRLWLAMACKIVGRGDQHAPRRHKLARDQARICERSDPYCHVDALLERIDEAVVEQQLDFEVRIGGHEIGYGAAEIPDAEGHRRVDPEHTSWLVVQARDLQLGLLD